MIDIVTQIAILSFILEVNACATADVIETTADSRKRKWRMICDKKSPRSPPSTLNDARAVSAMVRQYRARIHHMTAFSFVAYFI